jgi:hypothetical protein
MAINNAIGRDGSPSGPNPQNVQDGAFGEHALPKRKILPLVGGVPIRPFSAI